MALRARDVPIATAEGRGSEAAQGVGPISALAVDIGETAGVGPISALAVDIGETATEVTTVIPR
jgi:hypothetical protein